VTRKLPIWLVTLAMTGIACSGGGAAGRKDQAAPTVNITTSPSATSTLPGASASPSLSPGAVAKKGPGTGGGGGGGGPAVPTGFPIPNLFTAAENTIGFHKDRIVMCTHAALSLAAVFQVNADDLNAYWKYVNAELGGIYGRKVEMHYADDNYGNTAGDVPQAYNECKARKPFIMLGGIGFDQIPGVRTLAEQDHQLYMHHIAREDFSKKYSFSFFPSVETAGRRAAQWVLHQHKGKKVGVVYRASENWEPGHATFKDEMSKAGVGLTADLPVDKNDTIYTTQISTLKNRQVKVVFLWENALTAIEIIRQARSQGYNPQWVIFPFNLITDTLKDTTVEPIPLEGIAMWPAYRPGITTGSYSSYAAEIKLFEAKHQKYASGERDDITWMTWLGWHQMHSMLLACGKDCTRNRLVGLLQANLVKPVIGDCGFDFSRNGHVGGFDVNIFRVDKTGGKAGWSNVALCKRSF
jgi:ABC-type branched-subunit amino acid transport system substrate-binding protein